MGEKVYGLLGRKLGHSWSAPIHAALGCADYRLIELEPEDLTGAPQAPFAPEMEQSMQDYIDAVRSVSWWRPKYGAQLDPELVRDR